MVSLGRSTYTLHIRTRTQCSAWRLQGSTRFEGVSGITRLVYQCTYSFRFAHKANSFASTPPRARQDPLVTRTEIELTQNRRAKTSPLQTQGYNCNPHNLCELRKTLHQRNWRTNSLAWAILRFDFQNFDFQNFPLVVSEGCCCCSAEPALVLKAGGAGACHCAPPQHTHAKENAVCVARPSGTARKMDV